LWADTDISEERAAYIFRVEVSRALMKEAAGSSEIFVNIHRLQGIICQTSVILVGKIQSS
jgi:hypothetical protein